MTFAQTLERILTFLIQIFVIFPYSALTIQRPQLTAPKIHDLDTTASQRAKKDDIMKDTTKLTDRIYKLCTSKESVSSLVAQDPTLSPGEAWKRLYSSHAIGDRGSDSKAVLRAEREDITQEDLKRVAECGNWGPTKPSELFLRMYHDALCTLEKNVTAGMVSPSLMGSCGVIPLTIISVVPDIMRHMSNLIVRAEKEVFLATNYWQNSVASKYITDAMRELSRRAGERGDKIVMKIIYDRGSPKQLLEPHYIVSEKEYLGKAVGMPRPEEIPNIDLEVMNYHKPMLGTFHCKYMVVDRQYAVLQSNNIQDNDNVEMMTHLEGPIVDSLYDMALISWNKTLDPPLPSRNSPAVQGGIGSFGSALNHDSIFGPEGSIKGHSAIVHPEKMQDRKAYIYESRPNQPGVVPQQASGDESNSAETNILTGPNTDADILHPADGSEPGVHHISSGIQQQNLNDEHQGTIRLRDESAQPGIVSGNNQGSSSVTGNAEAIPAGENIVSQRVATENAPINATTGGASGTSTNIAAAQSMGTHPPTSPDRTADKYFHDGEQALADGQIEHPSPEGVVLPEHTADDPHYDVDIAGEVARVQAAVSPKSGETRLEAVTRHLNHTRNVGFKPAKPAPECAPHEEMTPYIPHPVHEAFPIAMVCREPYGTPNHHSVYNPQNEVWLSALRNAEKNVFIQSPTLNAEPLLPAILEACERGVDVYCYICLGYNDTGELLPMQGGTNEMVAHKLFTTLSDAGKKHLHWFWYIGKDQTVPIVAKKKKRDCHIKVMIVDEHIGIQGNGNQDTQSWYHSQEINVMFDSAPVCKAWIDGLRRNQNTHLYGQVSQEDGIWRDENGNQPADVIGVDPGRFSWAKGFAGALRRVQGAGDF